MLILKLLVRKDLLEVAVLVDLLIVIMVVSLAHWCFQRRHLVHVHVRTEVVLIDEVLVEAFYSASAIEILYWLLLCLVIAP